MAIRFLHVAVITLYFKVNVHSFCFSVNDNKGISALAFRLLFLKVQTSQGKVNSTNRYFAIKEYL